MATQNQNSENNNWVPMRSLNFLQFTTLFQPHFGPGVNSISNINEYQKMFLGSIVRPAHKADNPTAICEPNI
jgi:hypothetical protein